MARLKYSNVNGIPNLEAVSVTSNGATTTVSFNPVTTPNFYGINNNFFGGIWVKIPLTVTTSAEPLQFTTIGVSGSTVPVYLADGTQATVANIASTGPAIYLLFYDRDSNRLQLI